MAKKTSKPEGVPLSYFIQNDYDNIDKIIAGDDKFIDPKLREAFKAERKSLTLKGAVFNPPEEGSLSPQAIYIHNLARDYRTLTAKQLQSKADKKIIGEMGHNAFRDHVTNARREYPKETKANKKAILRD